MIAYLCWNRGVSLIGPARAGIYMHLMPVFGAILAYLFLGERFLAYHATGAALVILGIALTQRHSPRTAAIFDSDGR